MDNSNATFSGLDSHYDSRPAPAPETKTPPKRPRRAPRGQTSPTHLPARVRRATPAAPPRLAAPHHPLTTHTPPHSRAPCPTTPITHQRHPLKPHHPPRVQHKQHQHHDLTHGHDATPKQQSHPEQVQPPNPCRASHDTAKSGTGCHWPKAHTCAPLRRPSHVGHQHPGAHTTPGALNAHPPTPRTSREPARSRRHPSTRRLRPILVARAQPAPERPPNPTQPPASSRPYG